MKLSVSYLYPSKNFSLQTLKEGPMPLSFHPISAEELQNKLLLVKCLNFPYVPYASKFSTSASSMPQICQHDLTKSPRNLSINPIPQTPILTYTTPSIK